jgi:hypothetical protein
MYTALVAIHITFMVGSLVLVPLAILMATYGKRWSMTVAFFGVVSACFGTVMGATLLINAHASMLTTCVLLSAYDLVLFTIYGLGFGWGSEEHARLLKNTEAR